MKSAFMISILSFMVLLAACILQFSTVFADVDMDEIIDNFEPSSAAFEIENAVNEDAVIYSEANENTVYIDGDSVSQEYIEATSDAGKYIDALNKKGLYLNRELDITVTVKIRNSDLSEFTGVVIDRDNLLKIADVSNLKVEFAQKNEYISINNETICAVLNSYGELRLQLKNLFGTCTLQFLGKDGQIIDKYVGNVKLALPASNSGQTVYIYTNNTQENWGGQYNSLEGSIWVMTKYSGDYNVASADIEINDIGSLTDYEQQAIRFMTVRGYFELDSGDFNPYSTYSRYGFAESLVRMFFAIDNDAECSFSDVSRKYYKYIAASEQNGIVLGYEDGTFRGKNNVTVEEVISLASRTINQRNGYVYPEHVNEYLNFSGDNVISDWAKKEVALALREGIYSKDMELIFSDDILRKDAAVILYRLFMITNNTPEEIGNDVQISFVNQTTHKTLWTRRNAIIVVTVTVLINLVVLAAFLINNRKKKSEFRS